MKKLTAILLCLCLVLSWAVLAGAKEEPPVLPLGYADVDADGQITPADGLAILQQMVGKKKLSAVALDGAEVSADGRVDSKDALLILKYAVGKIAYFPANEALAGQKIVIKTRWSEDYKSPLWQAKIAQLEELYRMDLNVLGMDQEEAKGTVERVVNGQEYADIVEVSLANARQIGREKGMTNLKDYPLHSSVKNHALTRSVTIGEYTCGAGMIGRTDTVFGLFYNKDLLARYAPEYDLDEMYENKAWDFAAFRELAKQLTVDTDGDGKTNIYGFTGNTNPIGMASIATFGNIINIQGEKITSAYDERNIVKGENPALAWCRDLLRVDESWYYKAVRDQAITLFAQEQAMMVVAPASNYPAVEQQAEFAVGFIPFPIGYYQTDYVNATFDGRVYLIPKNKEKNARAVTVLLNELKVMEEVLLAEEQAEYVALGLSGAQVGEIAELVRKASPDYSSGVLSSKISAAWDSSVTARCKCPRGSHDEVMGSQAQKEMNEFYAPFFE